VYNIYVFIYTQNHRDLRCYINLTN